MLGEVSAYLLGKFKCVSVIARSESSFTSLLKIAESQPGILNPIVTDYSDSKRSLELISKSIQEFGKVDLCISWVHAYAENFGVEVASLIADETKPVFIDVLGSSSGDLKNYINEHTLKFSDISGIDYRYVVLGKIMISEKDFRWLTNREISNGVISAIESGRKKFIVAEI